MKCLNKKRICFIRYDIKRKCQYCRLLKCFRLGMRTDNLISPEDKLIKAKRIEENCQRCDSFKIKSMLKENDKSILNDIDRACLSHIEKSYLDIIESIPSASSVISFEPNRSQILSFNLMTNIDQYDVIKLICFLQFK